MANVVFFFMLFLCNKAAAAVTVSDIPLPHAKDFTERKQIFPSIHRALMNYFRYTTTQLDSIDPPTTPLPLPLPSPPITNPVTSPPTNSAPGVVTVPGANPVVNPPPATNPVVNPPPATNPVVNPPPVTNPPPVANPAPVTNPVNPPPTNNVNPPAPVTNPVTGSGGNGRWCIAKNGASQAALQSALDYACGVGGADCATIQQGSSCYEPASLENHASYAFNSYYQKNPAPTSCDFGGAAVLTNTNPSTGSCVYPSSSSSSSLPSQSSSPSPPQTPVNSTSLPSTPPATSSSSSGQGAQYPPPPPPPPGFSLGSPNPTGLGAYGASPPVMNTVSDVSYSLQPSLVTAAAAAACIITFGL